MREEKSERQKLLNSFPGGENKSVRGPLCHPSSNHRTRATCGQRYRSHREVRQVQVQGWGLGMLDLTSAWVLSGPDDTVRETQCEGCIRSQKKSDWHRTGPLKPCCCPQSLSVPSQEYPPPIATFPSPQIQGLQDPKTLRDSQFCSSRPSLFSSRCCHVSQAKM